MKNNGSILGGVFGETVCGGFTFCAFGAAARLHEAGDGKRCAEYGKRNGRKHGRFFLAEKTDDASVQAQSGHVEKTLSSGVMVDTGVYVPESMQQQNLPEMQGTGQEIDFEKIKEIFCAGKKNYGRN